MGDHRVPGRDQLEWSPLGPGVAGKSLNLSSGGAYRAPIEAETSREDLVPIGPVAERTT